MRHASDDELRSLHLGELRAPDSLRVQRHIYRCAPCLERLARLTAVLAAQGLEPKITVVLRKGRSLHIVHDTADGFIYAQVERKGRKWSAHHWGEQLDGGQEFTRMREANEYLIESFAQMFPEHRCTQRCRLIDHA